MLCYCPHLDRKLFFIPYFRMWQPTLATLWVETPQIPQQLSVKTLMSTFSFILYCLEWTLFSHILSMASTQNTFCFTENQDIGKGCTGPCSKCRCMISPLGHHCHWALMAHSLTRGLFWPKAKILFMISEMGWALLPATKKYRRWACC